LIGGGQEVEIGLGSSLLGLDSKMSMLIAHVSGIFFFAISPTLSNPTPAERMFYITVLGSNGFLFFFQKKKSCLLGHWGTQFLASKQGAG
jgi:hypothetical protein